MQEITKFCGIISLILSTFNFSSHSDFTGNFMILGLISVISGRVYDISLSVGVCMSLISYNYCRQASCIYSGCVSHINIYRQLQLQALVKGAM